MHREDRPLVRGAARLVIPVCAVIALAQLLALVIAARHGFDFTDEGFYLNSIARDYEGSVHVSSFGEVYRFLTLPLDGHVAALRWFNIATVLGSALTLGWAVTTATGATGPRPSRLARWALTLLVATPVLGFFGTGLLTPSYNSLAVIGLLLIAAGLVFACTRAEARVAATALVGVGGVLVFLGKPSSALAASIVAAAVLLTAGRGQRRVAVASVLLAASAVLVTSLLLTGSALGLLDQVMTAAEEARLMDNDHDLRAAVAGFGLPRWSPHILAVSALAAATSVTAVRAFATRGLRKLWWAGPAIAGTVATSYLVIDRYGVLDYTHPMRSLVIVGVAAGVVIAGFWEAGHITRPFGALVVGLLLLPHTLAFGSNNDYWHVAALLYVVWLAAGVLLLGLSSRSHGNWPMVGGLVPGLVLTALVIASVTEHPYRQTVPLDEQTAATSLGRGGELMLAPDFSAAIEAFRTRAREGGFSSGTPVIDLTGQMPGLIYAIDGRAAGAPWILGGYPGSDAVARRTLGRAPCDVLARAWLILEADGTRTIDASVLEAMGATTGDWTAVTTERLQTSTTPDRRITLLSPDGAVGERRAACQRAR